MIDLADVVTVEPIDDNGTKQQYAVTLWDVDGNASAQLARFANASAAEVYCENVRLTLREWLAAAS